MKYEDLYNLPKYAGIYCLRNKVNGKCYIGQSIKLQKRLKAHFSLAKSEKFAHILLYKAIKKYGWENFEITVLKVFREALTARTKDLLDFWEKKYIQEYDSYGKNGYNQTVGGDAGVLGYRHTQETKDYIAERTRAQMAKESLNPKRWIKAKNINDGTIIIEHGQEQMAKRLGVVRNVICKCANGKQLIAKGEWLVVKYNDEFPEITTEQREKIRKSGRYAPHKDKGHIVEYMKSHPKCRFKDVRKNFNICRKTFYNYQIELGLIGEQRVDVLVTKQEFLDYYKDHTKKECMEHFGIKERLYYSYRKQYTAE